MCTCFPDSHENRINLFLSKKKNYILKRVLQSVDSRPCALTTGDQEVFPIRTERDVHRHITDKHVLEFVEIDDSSLANVK